FALEIEIRRYRRPDHLALVADQRVGPPYEHARLLGDVAAGFGGVALVVDARAGDQLRVWDDRQEFDFGELVVGPRIGSDLLDLGQQAGRQRLTQAGDPAAEAVVQRDHAIAADHAERRLTLGDIARKLHSSISRSTGRQASAHVSMRLTIALMISTSAIAMMMPAKTPVVSDT